MSERASSNSRFKRFRAAVETLKANPSSTVVKSIRDEAASVLVGSGVGYLLSADGFTSGAASALGLVTGGLIGTASLILNEGKKGRRFDRQLLHAEPGDTIILTKSGSVREAWRSGHVQVPEQIILFELPESTQTPQEVQSLPIQSVDIQMHNVLTWKKTGVTARYDGRKHLVTNDDGSNSLLITEYVGARDESRYSKTTLRSVSPRTEGNREIFDYTQVISKVEGEETTQIGLVSGSVSRLVGEKKEPRIPYHKIKDGIDLTEADTDPENLAVFYQHIRFLKEIQKSDRIKLKTYDLKKS